MRYLYSLLGTVSLVVGIIGIFIPVLPTTPLVLLAAYCYYRGSRRMYHWLMSHPHLGTYIRNLTEKKIIPLHTKIVTLSLLWTSLLFCAYILDPLWLKALMIAIAIGVTWHILSYKSK